ncbi:MAG: crossover junction endodeoxyribonuclease RuvC [Bacteroidota bacterium]|jgi:crossover junction endodeoxyribonuclease RuvC
MIKKSDDIIIMGIDPGTNITGYGIIKVQKKNIELIDLIEFKLSKNDDHSLKLSNIFKKTTEIINKYSPDQVAIESPFFGKNVQSMLKLGRAQGVSMAAALNHEIPITEYSPKKIKMSITGNGNSTKEQVAKMLKSMLDIKEMPKNLDSTDGLAAAVCHYFNLNNSNSKKQFSNWSSFIKKNPDKIN